MKKIVPLLLALLLVFYVVPVRNALAASVWLFDMTYIQSTNIPYDARNNSMAWTPNAPASTWTTVFKNEVAIDSIFYNGNPGYTFSFYSSTNSLIGSVTSASSNYKAVNFNGVKKIILTPNSGGYVYEIGVNGTVSYPVVHDELNNLVVNTFYNKVDLAWDIPSTNAAFTGSKVYRNGTLIKTLDKNTKTYTDSALETATSYTYKVAATYSDGLETTGVTKTVTTLDAPKPPGEVTDLKEALSDKKVSLTWINPTDANFSKVKIYRNNVFLAETTGTSFNDLTIQPNTKYEYKITTISTEGLESSGITTTVTTPKEIVPDIEGVGYKKDANGDYEISWSEPTIGQIKILIDGQAYQTVNANLLKITIPATDMKYDILGNPSVSLVPISESGKEGTPTVPKPIDAASGVSTPFTVNDLVGTGINLLWVIGPLILLALVFLLVPKLRNLVFGSLRKDGQAAGTKENNDEKERYRFNSKERAERKEQQEKREQHIGKKYLAKLEKNQDKAITAATSAIRQPRQHRMPRERNRISRTPRAGRERKT